ncbi:HPr(Ser) kinase/phosphatase [Brochothrix campestris]|uniref:HPr kinase/phosphorylase n=1 Tax=Brochothrix campestris FSL F6-1037 TaxID=1265861 RepID=W7CSY0_9LIST|nr:HPr(Ser) kinase/phosphatase [Brochothrix campestris]EUJ40007.1 HPr kinase/phosphorylase [Brochothrix campestris FSL F6-1037]
MEPSVTVQALFENMHFKLVTGENGLNRKIEVSDLSRPGLELSGFMNYYPEDRIQLFGMAETSYLESLSSAKKRALFDKLCTPRTPAFVIARSLPAPTELLEIATERGIPVLSSKLKTTRLSVYITNFLETELAPIKTMHGVLVDIYGIGVLIRGKSGVGKSETALELVQRGHRLVADDSVEIRQLDGITLIGRSPKLIEHLLEIRGLGIVNVMDLFGAGSVRPDKKISLVIDLELWDAEKQYDRVGLEELTTAICDVQVPKITVPVRPGRNLAVIIEVACMNFRLKQLGNNAAQTFNENLTREIKNKTNN